MGADQGNVFRRLEMADLELGYGCLLETCAWLERKQIRQWLKPLPKQVYAGRLERGENYALFARGEVSAVVSLTEGIPSYWHDLVPDPRATWMATLAVRRPGDGIGVRTVAACMDLLEREHRLPVYLDCRTGVLERFYGGLGFERLAVRPFRPAPHFEFDAVLMRSEGRMGTKPRMS